MSRYLLVPLTLVALVPTVPATELPVAPAPRPVTSPRVAVAPMPHAPRELGLTIEDPGLEIIPLPEIEVERVPDLTLPKPVSPFDPIGLPDPPKFDPKSGLRLPPAPLDAPGIRVDDPKPLMAAFPGRTGATKAKLIREGGGNDASEKAVALGLAWLAKQQKADGGWEFDKGSKEERIAATGLVLQAFLASGETHKAGRDKNDEKKYTKVVAAGLDYLMKNCPASGANSGRMTTNMYSQAIGTTALCEAYGMTKDPVLRAYAQSAINYIMKAQGPNGSWGYSSSSNGDTSIVGWQIQALQAAKLSKDLVVDDRVIKKAVAFLNLAAGGSRKSMYGYADNTGAAPGTSLTSVGLLCRYYLDSWGPNHPGMIDGVAGLAKNPPPDKGPLKNLYYYYYATQVLHYFGEDDWKTWNEGPKGADGTRKGGIRDWIVSAQVSKDGDTRGSWEPETGFVGSSCGRLGTTAMCVLTLEVYYRHLPLYKRNAGEVKIPDDE